MTNKTRKKKRTEDSERDELDVQVIEPCGPEELDDYDRMVLASAETGGAMLKENLREHTSAGPEIAGGDLDANWESAEGVGDEAPGGHMATPDQDIVDEIGKAVGFEVPMDAELRSSEEVLANRDRRRWELDAIPGEDLSKSSPRQDQEVEDIPVMAPFDDVLAEEEPEGEEETLRTEAFEHRGSAETGSSRPERSRRRKPQAPRRRARS